MEVQLLKGGEFRLTKDLHRPEGLHQSAIITDMMQQLDPGRYAKKGPDGELIPMDLIKVGSGIAFEKALETAFRPASPGSFRPDSILVPPGIWVSPDSIDPDCLPGQLVVREFKLTWYSKNKQCPTDAVYWPWIVQIKGYCRAIGTQYAILTVLHINGDYHPPSPTPPDNYGLVFTPLELEENWQMLVNHATSKGWL